MEATVSDVEDYKYLAININIMIAITESCEIAPVQNSSFEDNICDELEVIFVAMGQFEDHVRITRKEFITRISDCFRKNSVTTNISSESILYQKLFLLYVKNVRTHISFKMERNRERFISVIDMETKFNDLTLESTALTTLRRSRRRSRSPEENELCEIHLQNTKSFRDMMDKVYEELSPKAVHKAPDDDSEEECVRPNKERDYLEELIGDYTALSKETFWASLEPNIWIADGAINFYLKRILQPMSDESQKGILFASTDVYESFKSGNSLEYINRSHYLKYYIHKIDTYVNVCNTPAHWITVVVKIKDKEIMCYDSLQPKLSEANKIILEKFAGLYTFIYGYENNPPWTLRSGLTGERLQNNGHDCGVWSMLFAEAALENDWNEAKFRGFDMVQERLRIKNECTKLLLSAKEYVGTFKHEGNIYKQPNPESERFTFDAFLKSTESVLGLGNPSGASIVFREVEKLDDGPNDISNISSVQADLESTTDTGAADLDSTFNTSGAADLESTYNTSGAADLESTSNTGAADLEITSNTGAADLESTSNTGAADLESTSNTGPSNTEHETSSIKRRRSYERDMSFRAKETSITPLQIKLRSRSHVDGDEVEWNDTAIEETTEVKVEDEMEVDDDLNQNLLPSQEDIVEDMSPVHKKRKSDMVSLGLMWYTSIDKLFLRLQIYLSFLPDYEFVEKESTPLDRARRLYQCAENYLEYRHEIQRLINTIENSEVVIQHSQYRKAIRKVVDLWNVESDLMSSKYISLKNKIPVIIKEELEDPEASTDFKERCDVILNYLCRGRDVEVYKLVDVFQKYIKQDEVLTISTNQTKSDLDQENIEETVEPKTDTVSKNQMTEPENQITDQSVLNNKLTDLSLERHKTIMLSFETGKGSELVYLYPRPKALGIANTGNSCFISVVLQLLWRIKPLLYELSSFPPTNNRKMIEITSKVFNSVVDSQSNISKRFMNPLRKELLAAFNMGAEDHDATELLFKILDQLDMELNIPFVKNLEKRKTVNYYHMLKDTVCHDWLNLLQVHGYSVVKDLFYSSIIYCSSCAECTHCSLSESELLNHIILRTDQGNSVEKMLQKYFDELFVPQYCPICNISIHHHRHPYFGRSPPVLIINIARNQTIVRGGNCEYRKYIGAVDIPEFLDITDYCFVNENLRGLSTDKLGPNKRLYVLRTIICHVPPDISQRTRSRGNSSQDTIDYDPSPGVQMGHYYICTRDSVEGWTVIDDVSVKTYESEEDFEQRKQRIQQDAYLLVYC